MLVLSRKKGERICIGDNVEVVVIEARGDRIRLGIEAPAEVPIHRHEVYCRMQREARLLAGCEGPHAKAS